jgi:hypothetical protein
MKGGCMGSCPSSAWSWGQHPPPKRIRPCTVSEITKSLRIGWYPEWMPHVPSKKTLGPFNSFNHCFRLSYFPITWKEKRVTTLSKPGKDLKFPQNLRPLSLVSTTGKLFENAIQKFVQRHFDEKALLNATQFSFRARNSTTLQCMRLIDHVTLNFNIVCPRLRYSWISKKPLAWRGTVACYTNYPNYIFQQI